MKTILLFCSFILCANIFSQSLVSDKKSVASKKTISTGTNPLYKNFTKTVQVQSQLSIQDDSIADYDLFFTATDLSATDNANSSSNACLLKDENGTMFSGALTESPGYSSGNSAQSYTCKFSKIDFLKIVALKISEIKITAAGKETVLPIDKKSRSVISNQAKTMLNRFRANNTD